jgi:tetratricopeptide (TPR) repeat protein
MSGLNRKISWIFGGLVFFISLGIYIKTLSPSVGFVDSGELTVVSYTLGIAHPTGYPLYTILGRLFTFLPWGSIAWRMNLVSAIFASLSVLVLYFLLKNLFTHMSGQEKGEVSASVSGKVALPLQLPLPPATATAFITSLLFAFSSTLWSQAVVAEVYSLTVLLSVILIFLILRITSHDSPITEIILFPFLFGLALGNHMTILTVGIPCTLFLFFLMIKNPNQASRIPHPKSLSLFYSAFFFFLGLTIYLYLPIRSAQSPDLNWGEPKTWMTFLWHITGKQYNVWFLKSSPVILLEHFRKFVQLLSEQFTPFILPLGILGIFSIFKFAKSIGFLLLAIFLLDIFYGINYDIPDIDSFFLPAFLITVLWIGSGLFLVLIHLPRRLTYIFLLLPLVPLIVHFHKSDKSENWIPYEFGMNALRAIEDNGLCLTKNWDIYSPVLYIRFVEGKRKDVVMIDKELLRRSWYLNSLKKKHSWLMERSRTEVSDFEEYLDQFEKGTLTDHFEIQKRFIRMINSFLWKNIETRPLYTTFVNGNDQDAPLIGTKWLKEPRGLVYQYVSPQERKNLPAWKNEFLNLRGIFDKNIYKDERTRIRQRGYHKMGVERGIFLFQMDQFSDALRSLKWTLKWQTEELISRLYMGLAYLELGEYENAEIELGKVLLKDPGNEVANSGLEELRRREGKKED